MPLPALATCELIVAGVVSLKLMPGASGRAPAFLKGVNGRERCAAQFCGKRSIDPKVFHPYCPIEQYKITIFNSHLTDFRPEFPHSRAQDVRVFTHVVKCGTYLGTRVLSRYILCKLASAPMPAQALCVQTIFQNYRRQGVTAMYTAVVGAGMGAGTGMGMGGRAWYY